ncbi:polysaccharide deacetylase family protein [Nioella nitratireducens]|uniref:polysaccharide deacetylase family protein n=1 Tax=Nioella nitratireducens TaxID=1287720 RepID=UPI0008FD37A0|nr:polysaccharide deacetylase family protein [Nioella nitratireducens]
MLTRRQFAGGAGAVVVSTTLPGSVWAQAQATSAFAIPEGVARGGPTTITRVPTDQPLLAMTFDDGPHETLTPQLLDLLRARGLRATFYLIGRRVARYPALARRIAEEGHEIGNHTWNHPRLTSLGNTSLLAELDRTTQIIAEATGRPPVTMRPPYGLLSPRQRGLIYETRRFPTVLWSVDPEDWRRPGSAAVARRIVSHANSGAVILSHDIIGGTVRAMPATLDGLTAQGYRFVTVSELIGWPRWTGRHLQLSAALGQGN